MFEENHIDDLMKSILENGREEVPARVWEGVSAGLDKAARRKTVVLWFKRAGIAAAAAAVVAGFVLNTGQEEILVPEADGDNMIAVVESAPEIGQEEIHETLLAEVKDMPARHRAPAAPENTSEQATSGEQSETYDEPASYPEEPVKRSQTIQHPEKSTSVPQTSDSEPAAWQEEETEIEDSHDKTRVSIVLSGIAGTNNPKGKSGVIPMRSPAMNQQYTKTTIEQVGKETTYGIPLSFGAGVKLDFTKRWSLGIGLNYSLLTNNFNGRYIKVENGIEALPVPGKVSNTQHYIGIPVNAYFNIISKDFINFYAYAGGTVEKCIKNSYRLISTPVITHTEQVKGVQLSADIGIGAEFMVGKVLGIYIDPSLRYYFRNGQPKSIRTAQPLMFGFEIGLRFNL